MGVETPGLSQTQGWSRAALSSLAKTQNSGTLDCLPPSLDPRPPSQEIVNENGGRYRDIDEDVPRVQPRVARKPKYKNAPGGQALWDKSIELTDDQLKDMCNRYEQRMSEE
ncbi:hypothetical protein FRB96_008302 [Tulasnella sp. 330]|nr:hypothetical protein FRB96_008302 [Tulasnella sp. 330]KAG8886170.1 hypothetical protein FRB97_007208 [Tulasnella sp. 331]KAG8890428.1 hypothetical protein FRB98_008463 [Tulasnella sp. 332]